MVENIALGYAAGVLSIGVASAWMLSRKSRIAAQATARGEKTDISTSMLFRDEMLIDATPSAETIFTSLAQNGTDRETMVTGMSPHFPDLRAAVESESSGKSRIQSPTLNDAWLEIDRQNGTERITFHGLDDKLPGNRFGGSSREALQNELALLRDLTANSPQLIWQEDKKGHLTWANNAYLKFHDLATGKTEENDCWPSTKIFGETEHQTNPTQKRRKAINLVGQKGEHWFDVTTIARDDGFTHFAIDASALVRAESAQHSFVQTLAKTFAQLSIGLAIFDKRRRLAVFNPALLDLTGLPVAFLSAQPTVDMLLDRLREARMLPEPKNYTTWRDQFRELEKEAQMGTYCENWNLPNGQTIRVTGRPHPQGALAFLFEDISAEISLTRRFRAEIETAQTVLDTMSDAVAVFSSAGTLVMKNAAYEALWHSDTQDTAFDRDLRSELKIWQAMSGPTAFWSDIRNLAKQSGDRAAWSDHTIMADGRAISCNGVPISGGKIMVKFSTESARTQTLRKLTQTDPAIQIHRR